MRRRVLEAGDIVRYRRKFVARGQSPRSLFVVAHVNPGEGADLVLLESAPEGSSKWSGGRHLRPGLRKKPRWASSDELALVEAVGERVAKALMGEG